MSKTHMTTIEARPINLAPLGMFRCWISSQPASAKSNGDFVACVQLEEFRHAIVVGDVAGRGEMVNRAATSLARYTRGLLGSGFSPSATLHLASRRFASTMLTDAIPFASVFVAITDLWEGTIRYASAGHEPPLLFGAKGSHRHLSPTGPVLGIDGDAIFQDSRVRLGEENLLVIFTDGITEARRSRGDGLSFFGTRGVSIAIRDAVRATRNPAEFVCDSARRHAGGALSDDASVFVSSLIPCHS
jgi:sigma-B regulation protein RsbU (phosphoserine phosphatase)